MHVAVPPQHSGTWQTSPGELQVSPSFGARSGHEPELPPVPLEVALGVVPPVPLEDAPVAAASTTTFPPQPSVVTITAMTKEPRTAR